jgi:hypothetical protein
MDIRDPLEDNSLRDFTTDKTTWIVTFPGDPPLYAFTADGKQPNAFSRLMQRICFGITWRKI